MKRTTTLRIRNFLDDWLPPKLRDSKIVSLPLTRAVFGPKSNQYTEFRDSAFQLSDDELAAIYERLEPEDAIQGETDLNSACAAAILAAIGSGSVLEVGSGRGYLLRRLSEQPRISRLVGVDLVEPVALDAMKNVEYVHGSILALPFADNEFDTVVCTHVLEHIPDVHQALRELRRVAAKQVIIVIPKERPYRWGFNLHVHFFPYRYNVDALTGSVPGAELRNLGDWFYTEPQGVPVSAS